MNSSIINPQILGEAADWLVQLHSGTATPADHQAIAQWRNRSLEHAQAWQRAEVLLGDFRGIPANLAMQTLKRASRREGLSRRQTLTRLGLLLLAGPLGFASQHLPWEQWTADQRTAVGEQKNLQLPDGSQLLLNTDSAVNIAFNPRERRVMLLSGELLISTAKDLGARPFIVETPQGMARAPGTRFCVRTEGSSSHVSVLEGQVMVTPQMLQQSTTLDAGQRQSFKLNRFDDPQRFDVAAMSWDKGMLLANNMRLDELLGELSRYRPGVLRCHPDVAALRVSGAFSLRDTDASLRLLSDTLPLNINRLTRYWLSVEPRV
ncbi:FecR domain-containing protein [Pseudomonas fluorescens]|jgi:transmembrane sensor|uniref:FecR domain-containing protein n=1 Tax=Pseudomonas fluorescens TaxID=294 RepID=UPI002ACA61B3|nr:FecR domain-containing protein [Pseudomonas fluorescens]MDZ5433246.1 FecR domain-containing protein [Pseudomonas fluorescens]